MLLGLPATQPHQIKAEILHFNAGSIILLQIECSQAQSLKNKRCVTIQILPVQFISATQDIHVAASAQLNILVHFVSVLKLNSGFILKIAPLTAG